MLPGLFVPVLPGLFVPVLPGLFVPVNSAMHADSESRDILADYSGFQLSPLFFNQKLACLAGESGHNGIYCLMHSNLSYMYLVFEASSSLGLK